MFNSSLCWIYSHIHAVEVLEPLMKACLYQRSHQILSCSLTSASLMLVQLWPLAVVTPPHSDLRNRKTRWKMERVRWVSCSYVDTLRDSCCCKQTQLCDRYAVGKKNLFFLYHGWYRPKVTQWLKLLSMYHFCWFRCISFADWRVGAVLWST